MRLILTLVLAEFLSVSLLRAEEPFKAVGQFSAVDEDDLLRLRKAVIEHPQPVVSVTRDGGEYFLLYPDGLVLRWRTDWPGLESARLSKEEYERMRKEIAGMAGFLALEPKYELTKAHHESNYKIAVDFPGVKKTVEGYGDFLEGGKEAWGGRSGRSEGPEAFAKLYDYLMKYPLGEVQRYEPPYIELTVAGYDYAPEASVEWPKEWPGLNSKLARRVEGYVIEYFILFPASSRDELNAFLGQRRDLGAILMDGRKVHILSQDVVPGQKDLESRKREDSGQ